jgi:hypothetical protein
MESHTQSPYWMAVAFTGRRHGKMTADAMTIPTLVKVADARAAFFVIILVLLSI